MHRAMSIGVEETVKRQQERRLRRQCSSIWAGFLLVIVATQPIFAAENALKSVNEVSLHEGSTVISAETATKFVSAKKVEGPLSPFPRQAPAEIAYTFENRTPAPMVLSRYKTIVLQARINGRNLRVFPAGADHTLKIDASDLIVIPPGKTSVINFKFQLFRDGNGGIRLTQFVGGGHEWSSEPITTPATLELRGLYRCELDVSEVERLVPNLKGMRFELPTRLTLPAVNVTIEE